MNTHKHISIFWIFFSLLLLAKALCSAAMEVDSQNKTIYPEAAKTAPKIDGSLDDETWQSSPLEENFITYNPLYGEQLPQKTIVWVSYDKKNLYFAILCYDNEPAKIKTSLTRRDNMFNDDWVGISLDALGNKQTSYDLFVNPHGIQGDILTSAISGEDLSPDFVWESAGKVTDQGYQVEMKIPLSSIQFKSGKEVKMGILFWRRISRLGISGSWPDIKPGRGIFNTLATLILKNIKKPLKLEILPSVVYSDYRERITMDEWQNARKTEFGVSLKYGITSSITADLTLNPDFSQVESDVFQVEVNQRYPIFYSEKRPFFMEGIDIFSFFTTPHGYFPTAVHTRRIMNPGWGTKLTGTVGKAAFGILAAGDNQPGEGQPDAFAGIARGKYSLGKDNYIGLLYSGRNDEDGYNRVFGLDLSCRTFKHQQLFASFLSSFSTEPDEKPVKKSSDFNLYYNYSSKPLGMAAAFEHIGKDFRMDSAFLMRTGIDEGWVWIGPNFYPDAKKIPWLKRVSPEFIFQYLHDLKTGMDDILYHAGLDFNFIKQGHLQLYLEYRKESWNEQTFPLNAFGFSGSVQLTKWLRLGGSLNRGENIFYEADPSFKGRGYWGSFNLTLQPNKNLNMHFNFNHTELSKGPEKLYNVNILYTRTTYQFNKYFFLRAVFQYDSYREKLLTDFLASFTFIPGTVIHVGYGGLYENRAWSDNRWRLGQGSLLNIKRSFFFKASYLWRF